MKARIYFNKAEFGMVLNAMKGFRLTLKGSNLKLFNIVFEKVVNGQSKSRVSLDGMEMIYLAQALRRRSKLFLAIRKIEEYRRYAKLADEVEQVRKEYQSYFGPKTKIAPTAGTVDAIAQ